MTLTRKIAMVAQGCAGIAIWASAATNVNGQSTTPVLGGSCWVDANAGNACDHHVPPNVEHILIGESRNDAITLAVSAHSGQSETQTDTAICTKEYHVDLDGDNIVDARRPFSTAVEHTEATGGPCGPGGIY